MTDRYFDALDRFARHENSPFNPPGEETPIYPTGEMDPDDLSGLYVSGVRTSLGPFVTITAGIAVTPGEAKQLIGNVVSALRDVGINPRLPTALRSGTEFFRTVMPNLTPDGQHAKLDSEVGEFHRIYQTTDESLEEAADIIIVLMAWASTMNVDLESAVEKKMAKNRARTWKYNGDGTYSHVKPEPDPNLCAACGRPGEAGRNLYRMSTTEQGKRYHQDCWSAAVAEAKD